MSTKLPKSAKNSPAVISSPSNKPSGLADVLTKNGINLPSSYVDTLNMTGMLCLKLVEYEEHFAPVLTDNNSVSLSKPLQPAKNSEGHKPVISALEKAYLTGVRIQISIDAQRGGIRAASDDFWLLQFLRADATNKSTVFNNELGRTAKEFYDEVRVYIMLDTKRNITAGLAQWKTASNGLGNQLAKDTKLVNAAEAITDLKRAVECFVNLLNPYMQERLGKGEKFRTIVDYSNGGVATTVLASRILSVICSKDFYPVSPLSDDSVESAKSIITDKEHVSTPKLVRDAGRIADALRNYNNLSSLSILAPACIVVTKKGEKYVTKVVPEVVALMLAIACVEWEAIEVTCFLDDNSTEEEKATAARFDNLNRLMGVLKLKAPVIDYMDENGNKDKTDVMNLLRLNISLSSNDKKSSVLGQLIKPFLTDYPNLTAEENTNRVAARIPLYADYLAERAKQEKILKAKAISEENSEIAKKAAEEAAKKAEEEAAKKAAEEAAKKAAEEAAKKAAEEAVKQVSTFLAGLTPDLSAAAELAEQKRMATQPVGIPA